MFIKFLSKFYWPPGPKYGWKKVLMIQIISTCLCAGGSFTGYYVYRHIKHLQATSQSCIVRSVIQTGPQFSPLSTRYLTEVLGLSLDFPITLSQFDLDEALHRLYATHVIKQASLKKVKPSMLYIDYTLREPIAYLGDYSNTAIDEEGVFFPFLPFFPPQNLPRVFLNLEEHKNPWGDQIDLASWQVYTTLLTCFDSKRMLWVDLSQMNSPFLGRREIVVILQGDTILRLNPKNYVEQLAHYSILERTLLQERGKVRMIDLRLPEVAYIVK